MADSATYAATAGVRVTRTGKRARMPAFLEGDRVVGGPSLKGRGATVNPSGRFEPQRREAESDGWAQPFPDARELRRDRADVPELPADFDPAEVLWPGPLQTTVQEEHPRSIITRNMSPDVPFDRSINAYRGCEHGCVYCYARPAHAYMGLSPGLDFESRLFAKPDAAKLFEEEISKPRYKVEPVAMGTNTDPYQPIEKKLKITRQLLEVCDRTNHPVTIVTKSRSIVRDVDLLASLAERNLVHVHLSVTTLDHKLSNIMEPRASSPQRRLDAVRLLNRAGVPTGIMMAPVIPAINDVEIEKLLEAAAHAGAVNAAWILLRLPLEVRDIFDAWLEAHFPDRRKKVMNSLKAMRGGRENDPRFGKRMSGSGLEAELLARRFANARKRFGLDSAYSQLNTELFQRPSEAQQLSLFA